MIFDKTGVGIDLVPILRVKVTCRLVIKILTKLGGGEKQTFRLDFGDALFYLIKKCASVHICSDNKHGVISSVDTHVVVFSCFVGP